MDYCENWYSKNGNSSFKIIRLSIFIIIGVCVGLPALFWALSVLYRHYKSRVQFSLIAVFLLITDLLELILNPFFVVCLVKKDSKRCVTILKLLFGARLCGNFFHQLVALESISQRYRSLANIFTPPHSITLAITVFPITFGCPFISNIGYVLSMVVCVLPLIVCAVTYLLTWKAPHDTSQATNRKPGLLVLTVAMFTMIILYKPFFLTIFADLPFTLHSLTNLRLISDPLLCVLVCREMGFKATDDVQ